MNKVTTEETVRHYVGAWDEKTPETIKAALSRCCAPEINYTDRQTPQFSGIDALTSLIMASYEKVPGRTFSVLTTPECFDNKCHYNWGIHIPGTGDLAGWDYLEYNNENLITRIVGFIPA